MPPAERARRTGGATRLPAFTLIELLVVLAIVAILMGLMLPALVRAKQKANQISCMSNLKQVGAALQMYADDHGDSLPGPCWIGARASYDRNASTELIFYIATYLGAPSPSGKTEVADAFVCPGYRRLAPEVTSMVGRKCYLLNGNVDPNPNNWSPPFGYVDPEFRPLKHSQLSQYGSPAELWAITDVDKINVPDPGVSWWTDLPYKPVHGQVRNELYFDWHVATRKVW